MTAMPTFLIEHYITVGGGIIIALVTAGFAYAGIRLEQQHRHQKSAEDDHGQIAAAMGRIECDIGGIRSELRSLRRRVDHVDERLDHHIDR